MEEDDGVSGWSVALRAEPRRLARSGGGRRLDENMGNVTNPSVSAVNEPENHVHGASI